MRPELPPSAYWDQDTFLREKNYFYKSGWHFFGHTSDLSQVGDYQVRNIWGHSLFKQKVSDYETNVYLNVCPHRYSQIRCKQHGNEPLVCPYHGWAFDPKNGKAIGIPEKAQFCFQQDEEADLRLKQWQVEACGEFLFASRQPRASLAQYLGDCFEPLKAMSAAMGEKIDENTMDIEANWKIIVENTLESYHVRKIHPESFAELGASGTDFVLNAPHSSWKAPLNERTAKGARMLNKLFHGRPIVNEHYEHYLAFPNLTVATSFGLSFSIQEIIPLTAEKTRFISHVYLSKVEQAKQPDASVSKTMAESIVAFNKKVFAEDKHICELVQLGSRDATSPGFLSLTEKRVEAFQKAIKEVSS